MHFLNGCFQNYDTSESKLRREFEGYGPIKKVSQYEGSLTAVRVV